MKISNKYNEQNAEMTKKMNLKHNKLSLILTVMCEN